MNQLVFYIFLLSFSASIANTQELQPRSDTVSIPWGAELGLIEHATLTINDEVSDNCWTNASTVRSKVYLILEQNGVFVPDYSPAFFNFRTVMADMSAFGFRTKSGICAVSARFRVRSPSYDELGGAEGKQVFSIEYTAQLFERASIFTSGTNSNEQISQFFEGAVSEFAAKIISAKRVPEIVSFWENYPSPNEPPMSEEEFQELISRLNSEDGQ